MRRMQAIVCGLAAGVCAWAMGQAVLPPGDAQSMPRYEAEFFPGARYDAGVKTPSAVLGYEVGSRAATPEEIAAVVRAIAESSARAEVYEYGRTHEGRPLHLLVIASEQNMSRLGEIKAEAAKLADGVNTSAAEADDLAGRMPAIAWMAYSIHGDEMSGADAALVAAHHLAASEDAAVKDLLANVVVIIDPLMNPDGRGRRLREVAENRTVQASVDDQSILHSQAWPGGRTNHYLFDLNRDWLPCTQPETQGRVKAAREWNPHYFMESHEMGSQDTFLFSPPREPINPNIPANVHKWIVRFGAEQAKALDGHGWRYYTGEWNEEWYPGYSGSWGALRGAIDNLYEQANIQTDAVRRAEQRLETYREAVHKQLVSTMANLATLSENRSEVLRDFAAGRRASAAVEGKYAKRVFAVTAGGNASRMKRFTDLMEIQGISMYRTTSAMKATGRDRLGRNVEVDLPAGTLMIPNRQQEGALIAAMMEFDPRMSEEFLTVERREILRFGQSKLYDVTGWSIPMLYDVQCYELNMEMPDGVEKYREVDVASVPEGGAMVAWVIDGSDDASVAAAARLMREGVQVRAANKGFELSGRNFARGSVVVTAEDNRGAGGELGAKVSKACEGIGVEVQGVGTGMGAGDLPDLGGEHFVLLALPRVAVVGRGPFDPYSYGEVWYTLDHEMGMEAAYVNGDEFGGIDVRRYNVIVLPNGADEGWVNEQAGVLKPWVEAGGTLIAIGSSASAVAGDAVGVRGIRRLGDVLTNMSEFREAVVREWEGLTTKVDASAVWSQTTPEQVEYPRWGGEDEKASDDEVKRRDSWRAMFMPQGAVLAGRVDDRHYLTAGCGEYLPVMYGARRVMVSKGPAQAAVRLGVIVKGEAAVVATAAGAADDEKDGKGEQGKGWRHAPAGHELRLRMSGLLWPEAADRLAHGVAVAREGVGSGQVIVFAETPTFRGATLGTRRVFENAVVYGPGMGASAAITSEKIRVE